jgi:hypothetical protein
MEFYIYLKNMAPKSESLFLNKHVLPLYPDISEASRNAEFELTSSERSKKPECISFRIVENSNFMFEYECSESWRKTSHLFNSEMRIGNFSDDFP